jgi:hypothetical protein
MSQLILYAAPSRVLNAAVLEITAPPRKFLGRGFGIVPRGTVTKAGFWRLVAEFQLLRYLVALTPFPVAMLIWPHLALPISQAPLLMFLLVYLVESRVLAVPKDARKALIGEVEAARALDAFRIRGAAILSRIAAGRGMTAGELHLAVEQSELARVAPLTVVSVQLSGPPAHVLDLTDAEVKLIETDLFAEGLDERLLHRVNLAQNTFLRSVAFDASAVSAHARLEALAQAQSDRSGARIGQGARRSETTARG